MLSSEPVKPTRLPFLPLLGVVAAYSALSFQSADGGEQSWRYYRFTTDQTRGLTFVQLSEIEIRYQGNALPGATATNPGGDNPLNEQPANAVDGNTATKWLDRNTLPIILDFGAPTLADSYSFATANDAPERDPISWTLEGSNDQTTWELIDSQVSYDTTGDRFTFEQDFLFCPDVLLPNIVNFGVPEQIVTNGSVTDLAFDILDATSATINLGVGAVTPPTGSISVDPVDSADTTYTLTATNPDGEDVATATVRSVIPTSQTYQFVRFTPIRLREELPGWGNANSIQISEFDFFNNDVEVVPVGGSNPGGNSPSAEQVGNLIDGNNFNKWLNFNKFNPVIFDFGAPVTIDSYRWTTGNDFPDRDPVAWLLEGSDDQTNWTTIDSIDTLLGDPDTQFNFFSTLERQVNTQVIPLPLLSGVPQVDVEVESFSADLVAGTATLTFTSTAGTNYLVSGSATGENFGLLRAEITGQAETTTVTVNLPVPTPASYLLRVEVDE